MQSIKDISISGGSPVIFLPLSFILIISGIKDLCEDLKRHKSDSEENNRKTLVVRNGKLVEAEWKTFRVGEIIKVKFNI